MFEDLQIAIPSRSRAKNMRTIYNLSENLWPRITLVVPFDQYSEYMSHVPSSIRILPFESGGIGMKREFIMHLKPTGKLIMMDDDLKFYKRTEDGSRFPGTLQDQTEQMVKDIVDMLDQYCMVGLTDKFMSQTKPRGYVECHRFNQVLGFNRDTLPKPWPQFRLHHDEEHDVHLQLLTKGHKTATITEWSKGDRSNSPGGCSDWRTAQILQQTHEMLMELWPGIVTVTPDPPRARYNWKEAKRLGGL